MIAKRNQFGTSIWQMTLMALRYLNGRRLRTVLTTLAIVFGVALIFAINLTLPSIVEVFSHTLTTVTGADLTITSVSGESFAPAAVLATVTAIPDVHAVTGLLQRQITLPNLGNDNALTKVTQINVIGIDPTSAEAVREFKTSDGRFLQADDTGKVVFPAGVAEFAPQLKVGTTFPFITASGLKIYSVVGLLAEQGSLSAPQMYVTLSDAQAIFNQPGLINTLEVSLVPGADRDSVSADILGRLGSDYQINASNNASATFAAMQIGLSTLDLMGVLALFLGAFLIFNTFRTVVIERRHDLGMLRALGATRRQITTLIVIESLIQGLLGTIIGLVFGFLLALVMTKGMNQVYSTYFGSNSEIKLQLSATAFVLAIVLGLVAALVAGYLPARSAGKTSPLEALRPEPAANAQRAARWSLIGGVVLMVMAVGLLAMGSKGAVGGAFLFLIGMVIAAPALVVPAAKLFSPLLTLWFAREGDLARGNLQRQPGRAAITGSTLMIGLAVLILMFALVSAFSDLVTSLTTASFSSDITLVPQALAVYNNVIGADSSLGSRLKELPDVETIASLRYASGSINGQTLEVLGIDPNDYPKVASLEFSEGDSAQAMAALGNGRNAILSSITLTTLKLNMGDDFVLQTSDGPKTYHIVGVGNDVLTFKVSAVFISQANLAADFHKSEDVMVMLNLKPGTDKQAALAKVQDIAKDYPQLTAHLTGQYRDEIMTTTSSAFVVFYFLAFLILIPAALGLLNTLTINVLERTREIGVVRAVGGSRSQVRRMVTGEALLLGIFSAAMGVLTGVAISYGFIGAFGTIGWKVSYAFPVIGIIAAVIVGVLLAMFAAVLPARNAAKLDIIRALQYE